MTNQKFEMTRGAVRRPASPFGRRDLRRRAGAREAFRTSLALSALAFPALAIVPAAAFAAFPPDGTDPASLNTAIWGTATPSSGTVKGMGIQTARSAGYAGVLGSKVVSGSAVPNVTVFDADTPLQDLNHVELAGQNVSVAPGGRQGVDSPTHGQAAAGVLVGKNIGIVPGAQFVNVPSSTAEDGIAIPMTTAVAGDVILLEQAVGTYSTATGKSFAIPVEAYGVETAALVQKRIRAASDLGAIVVEAAGNGNNGSADFSPGDTEDGGNLDYTTLAPYFATDSGAIIAGAGIAPDNGHCDAGSDANARSRVAYSTYGTRVDVQGPEDCIPGPAAESGSWTYPAGAGVHNQYNYFSGTSGASAVVAGVAAATSSAYKAWSGGTPPTPDAVRNALRRTSSAQIGTASSPLSKRIGGLVNLKGAIDDLEGAPTTSATGPTVNTTPRPSFSFSSGSAGVTYQCRIIPKVLPSFDALVGHPLAPFAPCSGPTWSPSSDLANGEYKLQVRAVTHDSLGDSYDATPAQVTFTQVVDSGTPVVSPDAEPERLSSGSYTLRGLVSPHGLSTTTSIEFGATTAYGSSATSLTVAPGAAKSVPIITGTLAAGTYHYRTIATNSAGTTYGKDQTFGTPIVQAGQPGDEPTPGVSNSYVLHGTVDSNGLKTTTSIQLGTTTSYGTTLGSYTVAAGVSETVPAGTASLTPGTTYHYRTVATNSLGTTNGPDQTFTVGAPTVTIDAAPLYASSGSYTLRGRVTANGSNATTTIEFGPTTSYGSSATTLSVNAGDSKSVPIITGPLTSGTTYHYRTVAVNTSGTTYGVDQTFVAGAPTVAIDAAPLVATGGSYTLRGKVTANSATTTTTIEFGPTTAYGSSATTLTVNAGDTKSVPIITGPLTAGTTYHYRTVATNAAGTTKGPDQTFTAAGAPIVLPDVAPLASGSSYTLRGFVIGNGLDTTTKIEFGTTTSYGSSATTLSVVGNAYRSVPIITGPLTAGTTYHYRTVATNAIGTTYGPDLTFTA